LGIPAGAAPAVFPAAKTDLPTLGKLGASLV